MNFFKYATTVFLKMGTTGKRFGKICVKTIRDAFFPICGL